MSLWRQVRTGVRNLLRRGTADAETAAELEHFAAEVEAENRRRGLSPADAARAARLEIGSRAAARDEVRSYGWEARAESVWADLRYALRVLGRTPVFTGVAIVVIAIGTGAVTTAYSGLNALVLRPLPGTTGGDRLVQIDRRRPDADDGIQASYAYFDHLRRGTTTFDGIAAWSKVTFAVSNGGAGIGVYGNLVSGNYFSVLGARPALGRFFAPEEDSTPLGHPVLVVSHAFWTGKLGGDSAAIGRPLLVNGHPYTLIGVAEPAFHGVFSPILVEAWVPLAMQAALRPGRDLENQIWLWTFGRLNPGVSADAGRADLTALTAQYIGAGSEPATRAGYTAIRLLPMHGLPADAQSLAVGFIGLLLGAAVLVLMIASVNVASMLSARSLARRREFAVRAALGAGRPRLLRQLLTEILLLFAAGAGGGGLLAWQATAALERIPIPGGVPMVLEISPDGRVFAFTLLLALATGLGFGTWPALRAARTDPAAQLRDGGAGTGTRRRLLNDMLIAGQLALSLVLLVTAGLFVQALVRGARLNPGFEAGGVVTAAFNTEAWGYDEARGRAFYQAIRDRLEGTPGVTAVSFTSNLPLAFATSTSWTRPDAGSEAAPDREGDPIQLSFVEPGYFAALRLPLVAGRPIDATDGAGSPPVAVINEAFARRYWPDGSAVGRTFWHWDQRVTVVGVARDAKYGSLTEALPAFAYFPVAQRWLPNQVLLVRSSTPGTALAGAVRAAVLAFDPTLPPPFLTTLREENAIVLLPQRIAATVTAVLGAAGLVLAMAGLYGVIAYSVGRRTREIGLRVALGAERRDLLRMVVAEGVRLALGGVAAGLLLAAAATRLLAGLLIEVQPLDPATFGGMAALLLGVAAIASYVPARRAAATEPMAALRVD
ncbi:MAG: ADOP family duplicated permease [Gemmatimonadales bacterium]